VADDDAVFEPFEPTTGARRLKPGESYSAVIQAREPWVSTGVYVEAGESYALSAAGTWVDKDYESGPEGYDSRKWYMHAAEWLRRYRQAKWFALIGCVGRDRNTTFVIGRGATLNAKKPGVLVCYANDVPWFYFNNKGTVTLTIRRTV
jgi:hypothetical protein